MRKTKKVVAKALVHKHAFKFKIPATGKTITSWAVVKPGKKVIDLELKAADVRLSMSMGGVGNTQCCTMALCAKRQANLFPHPVEGYIDWQYSRAYVVSKVSKITGLPIECYSYVHYDSIARMQDTKGGQAKLCVQLEKAEAEGYPPRKVRLLKARVRGPSTLTKPTGISDGSRSSKVPRLHGANLRFAVANLGGVDD
jgi:hypothetical protein